MFSFVVLWGNYREGFEFFLEVVGFRSCNIVNLIRGSIAFRCFHGQFLNPTVTFEGGMSEEAEGAQYREMLRILTKYQTPPYKSPE